MYTPPSSSPSASSSESSIQDIINSWMNALTKPSIPSFEQEAARTTQNRILLSIGLATVVAALLGVLTGFLGTNFLRDFLYSLITTPILFLCGVAALYVGARSQGGTGTLEQQTWVQSTFWGPILVLSAIPFIGWLFALVGFFYEIYLTYLTVQAVHRLRGTQAIIAMVIAVVLSIIFWILVGIILNLVGLGRNALGG